MLLCGETGMLTWSEKAQTTVGEAWRPGAADEIVAQALEVLNVLLVLAESGAHQTLAHLLMAIHG